MTRVKKFRSRVKRMIPWTILISWIGWLVWIFAIITFNDYWGDISYYPEEEYRLLEEEAMRMINEEDLESEEYEFVIENYDSRTGNLEMKLYSNRSVPILGTTTFVTAKVKNYKMADQMISLTRVNDNAEKHEKVQIIGLVFLGLIGAAATFACIMICSLILILFLLILDVIKPKK